MIQLNPESPTLSGFFGIPPERQIEILKEFEIIRHQQKEFVLNDILRTYKEDGIDHIGYQRVPVLNAYMNIAKDEREQLYVAFMAQVELNFFSEVMNNSVCGALFKSLR